MKSTTDLFYHGLIVGIMFGLSLNMIKNYIFKTIRTSQQESKSLLKENEEFKMALLVRHDLKMGKGKVAAQVRQYELNSILEFKYF